MFRNLGLRKRFMLILVITFIISLPVMVATSYYILKRNSEKEILEQTKVLLSTMESARKQIAEKTRPAVMRELPNKFVVEAMSGVFHARGIAERIRDQFPQYIYKQISTNPRHLSNKADEFEEELIKDFQKNKDLREKKGFITKGFNSYFYIAIPIVSIAECMKCHSTPENAPPPVIENYGQTASFGWEENKTVAANIMYVPTKLMEKNIYNALALFTVFLGAIFVLIFLVIDGLIVAGIIKPIEQFTEVADEVSRGNFHKDFVVKSNDEIKVLANAFIRMKLSLQKAMDILKKK